MTVHRARAHAKINLALAITGVRDDGYHLLRSVFLRLALHDVLEVEVDDEAMADTLSIDGELPPGADNLVLRSAGLLRERVGGALPWLRFHLTKRVPVAAGLGGGSADGAAAIDLALAAWGVRLHPAERLDAALSLGADVPFLASGHGAALVDGIGEGLRPLPAPDPPAGLLLITPPGRLSTTAVFAELDRGPSATSAARERVDEVAAVLGEGIDGMTLAATTSMLRDANDLWRPAVRLSPALATARDVVESALGHAVMLTGSGPTLFAVYPSEAAATRAAIALQTERPAELEGAAIISTHSIATGGGS